MKKRVRARRTLYYKTAFWHGSGVKMTTVTSKATPKYEVIEKISCKKQCFVLK